LQGSLLWREVCRVWDRARLEFRVFCSNCITCSVCSFRFSLVRLGSVLLVSERAALLSIALDREEEREERGEVGTREGRVVLSSELGRDVAVWRSEGELWLCVKDWNC